MQFYQRINLNSLEFCNILFIGQLIPINLTLPAYEPELIVTSQIHIIGN